MKDSCSNCDVMTTTDHSHIKHMTPMDTKKKELAADNEVAPDIDSVRARETTRRRAQTSGEVKPI